MDSILPSCYLMHNPTFMLFDAHPYRLPLRSLDKHTGGLEFELSLINFCKGIGWWLEADPVTFNPCRVGIL